MPKFVRRGPLGTKQIPIRIKVKKGRKVIEMKGVSTDKWVHETNTKVARGELTLARAMARAGGKATSEALQEYREKLRQYKRQENPTHITRAQLKVAQKARKKFFEAAELARSGQRAKKRWKTALNQLKKQPSLIDLKINQRARQQALRQKKKK